MRAGSKLDELTPKLLRELHKPPEHELVRGDDVKNAREDLCIGLTPDRGVRLRAVHYTGIAVVDDCALHSPSCSPLRASHTRENRLKIDLELAESGPVCELLRKQVHTCPRVFLWVVPALATRLKSRARTTSS